MNTPAPVPQSSFVTVLAWVMIAFGIFGILMGLLQNVLLNMLLPALETAIPLAGPAEALPLGFFRVAMLASLALAVFMTYGAYALLKRRNWARILYMGVFIVSAVLHVLVAAVFGFGLIDLPTAGTELMAPEIQSALRAMAITLAILMLAMAAGYVWLVHRLRSPAIAAEFGVPGRPAV